MSDLISRQAAIELCDWYRQEYSEVESYFQKFHEELKELPSAQSEPKTGKWIEKEIYETRQTEEMQVARCSNCKKYLTTPHIYSFNHYNYCPHCGTKMGGEK